MLMASSDEVVAVSNDDVNPSTGASEINLTSNLTLTFSYHAKYIFLCLHACQGMYVQKNDIYYCFGYHCSDVFLFLIKVVLNLTEFSFQIWPFGTGLWTNVEVQCTVYPAQKTITGLFPVFEKRNSTQFKWLSKNAQMTRNTKQEKTQTLCNSCDLFQLQFELIHRCWNCFSIKP